MHGLGRLTRGETVPAADIIRVASRDGRVSAFGGVAATATHRGRPATGIIGPTPTHRREGATGIVPPPTVAIGPLALLLPPPPTVAMF